jgi:hypothetical protein
MLAARPELTKLAEHTEPDFIAEAYLAGQGWPVRDPGRGRSAQ